jgi:predicted TIM-barrel fold metal-dependent hydrolase
MSIPRPSGGIFDGHCHVASTDFIPRSFLQGSIDNVIAKLEAEGVRPNRSKVLEFYLSFMQDHNCDQLAAEMEASGIDRTVLLLPDFTYALRDCTLTIAEMFDRHRRILQARPQKFFVFAGVDPRWGNDGVQLFEKGLTEFGFSGMKLYPPCGYTAADRALYPFYEICAAHALPVVVHTGGTSPALAFDLAHPRYLDSPARDFPNVNFILAHGSTAHVEDCIISCAFRPNIFLDVSAYQAKSMRHLREVFGHGVNHKIIFGTDWPVFRLQGLQRNLLDSLLDEDGPLQDLRSRELDAFFGRTLERLISRSHLRAQDFAPRSTTAALEPQT